MSWWRPRRRTFLQSDGAPKRRSASLGGLMKCSQPSGCCAFIFAVRLASHPFMHPLLQAVGRRNLRRSASLGGLMKCLPSYRPLPSPRRGSGAPRDSIPQARASVRFARRLCALGCCAFIFAGRLASHPFMHPLSQAVGRRNSGAVCFARSYSTGPALRLDLRGGYCVRNLIENEKKD